MLGQAFLAFSVFVDSDWAMFLSTAALCAALTWWKKDYSRLTPIVSVISLSFLLALALKPALGLLRPCAFGAQSGVPCPDDFSLPSVHSAVAFGLAAATIGLRTFPVYFIWGLLIGLSRIYLNVHTVSDVGAAMALALFSTAIIDVLGISEGIFTSKSAHRNFGRKILARDELSRKAVQAAIGAIVIGACLYFGSEFAVQAVAYCLAFGIVLFHLKSYRFSMPIIDTILHYLERPGAPAGFGALNFFIGILISLTLIPDLGLALSTVFILSVSDGAAAFFGISGKSTLPYNRYKTLRGSGAFFLFALPAFLIGGAPALVIAALATLIESLPLPIDDNLSIPWAGVMVFALMRAVA